MPVIRAPWRRAGDGHGAGGLLAGRNVCRKDGRAANGRLPGGDTAGPGAKAIYKETAGKRLGKWPGEFDRLVAPKLEA